MKIRHVTIALLFLGVLLRLRAYLADRSLWLDEAMLALNIIHRGFVGLWKPLDMHQGAPVGFLMLVRSAVISFGTGEYALRLVPLLAGIAAVGLFYLLAKRVLLTNALPLAVALFALSPSLIYYSSEVKQYSLDVAIALLLILLAVEERIWTLALIGAIAIWFSHPAIFILAGIGLARPRLWPIFPFLGISFATCYFLLLRHADPVLFVFWQANFMHLSPRWFLDAFFDFFRTPGALDFIGLAGFAFLCGSVALWKRNRDMALLLLAPVAATLAASALHKYPFGGRLVLFLLPIALLFIAEGVEAIRVTAGNQVGVILLSLLLLDPAQYSLRKFIFPLRPANRAGVMPLEEMRPVLAELAQRQQPGDCIDVIGYSRPAFDYYAHDRFHECVTGRVWLLLSHLEGEAGEEPKETKRDWGTPKESISEPGAEADLYLR